MLTRSQRSDTDVLAFVPPAIPLQTAAVYFRGAAVSPLT
jgi:hypothetical protein